MTPFTISNLDFNKIADDSSIGYIFEIDLYYPPELHDKYNDYPLAPESVLLTENMLSPFCKSFNQKHVICSKLVPNLYDKEKYVVHYRNLKLYVSLGLVVTKVHRVLSFDQKPGLKPFIDFNTAKRKNATNELEKDLFKLMNNSCYGKTMENKRNRKNIELISDVVKFLKRTAKPQLDSIKIINEDIVLVDRVVKTLDKPMYAGFCSLELSKWLMYDFHYNTVLKIYGDNARLLFTDTDSLCYHVKTHDLYEDMIIDRHLYDTSNFDVNFETKLSNNQLYSNVNARVIGKFKDECSGRAPIEFIGLRSKMYSLLVDRDEPSKKTAKGVKRSFVKKHVRHEMYLHTLKNRKCTHANFVGFRSHPNVVQTVIFLVFACQPMMTNVLSPMMV